MGDDVFYPVHIVSQTKDKKMQKWYTAYLYIYIYIYIVSG